VVLQELNIRIGILLDDLKKNAEEAKTKAKGIEATFRSLKSALISLGVFAFMKSAVAEFLEADRVSANLALRIRALGGDFARNKKAADDFATSMSRLSGIEDDELKKSMNSLLDQTHDLEASMSLMTDAMDLAKGTGMDLKQATDLVGQAYAGNRMALMQLGRTFGVAREQSTDFGTVMKAMRAQVQGAATDQRRLDVQIGQGATVWLDFKENIGQALSGFVGLVGRGIRPTIEFLGNLKVVQDQALGGLYKLAGNLRSIFTLGFKGWAAENKRIIDDAVGKSQAAFERQEDAATKVKKIEQGKQQRWSEDYLRRMRERDQKDRMERVQSENQFMKNRVSLGQATEMELLDLQRRNAEEVAAIYGQESKEFQEYQSEMIETAKSAYASMYDLGNASVAALSQGFESMFGAIIYGSASAGDAIAIFGKTMAKSLLNSVASVIEGEAVKGMAGYLSNMLLGGPLMAGVTSAYSLPLIASLAALSGVIRGISAGLAEGGVMGSPSIIRFAEKEPEAAIPFSRMGEAFQMYSQFLDKRGGGSEGRRQVNVTIDNRGAMILDSGYEERRAAKKIGDALKRSGII